MASPPHPTDGNTPPSSDVPSLSTTSAGAATATTTTTATAGDASDLSVPLDCQQQHQHQQPAGDSQPKPAEVADQQPPQPQGQHQQHRYGLAPDPRASGREYKRVRGELALDPFNDPDGTRAAAGGRSGGGGADGDRRGGAQGKPAKDVWSDLAMPSTAPRPGFGTAGQSVRLYANMYSMTVKPQIIYHYDVDFRIAGLDKDIRYDRADAARAWAAFAPSHPQLAHVIAATAFDGLKNAYTPVKIPFDDANQATEGHYTVEFQLGTKTKRWVISLGLVNEIDMSALIAYTSPKHGTDPLAIAATPNVATTLQALDILLRSHVGQEYKITSGQGRKFFRPGFQSTPLPLGAEVLRGLFQSVRPTIGGPALQLDTAYSAFIRGGNLKDVCQAVSGGGGGGRGGYDGGRVGYSGGGGGHGVQPDWRRMKKYLKGAKVTLVHRQLLGNPLTIFGFTTIPANEDKFEIKPRRKRGEPEPTEPEAPPEVTTIADYYRRHYNIVLQRPDWPCVDLKEKRMRVPVELAILLPGQPVGFTLMQPDQTAAIIKVAAKGPKERKREIEQTRAAAGYDSAAFGSWGVGVSTEMLKVAGRVLEPPRIQYHPASSDPSPRVSSGVWNNMRANFSRPGASLQSWAFLSFDQRMDERAVQAFATSFVKVLRDNGMSVENETPVIHRGTHDLLRSLKETGKLCVQQAGRPPQLLMIIVPDRMTYEPLKRHCASDLPVLVPSQMMMANKIVQNNPRALNQYQNNVAMKVNLKLGGTNWGLGPADLPKDTMILGCDVTHPNPGSRSASMSAVCGTTDPTASDYKVEIRLQDQRVEIITRMDEMVRALLNAWKDKNGSLPRKIVCFRDGISDGEFHQVVQTEIASIRQACQELSPNVPIKITYVSAGKRHHQRFFASEQDERMCDKRGNLPPGTVIDRTVTQPLIWDFYLQAHAGLIGTSKPTHYCILADENGFGPDEIQRLTNSLSFVFGRATRSVSLVTPAYYADIALEKCRVLAATEFDDASTTFSGHSGPGAEVDAVALDPDFFTRKLGRAAGFANMWFM